MELVKDIFSKINDNDMSSVDRVLMENKMDVDACDDHGMTALQHAAYKGNTEIVQFLLDRGADSNWSKHEHSYSPLHFAALSGSTEVCKLLLHAGSKTYTTNSVGRTASQMAAFVGHHDCVSLINNFISKEDIEYYTVPRGFDKEAKLQPHQVDTLHKLVVQVNFHPIKLARTILDNADILEHLNQYAKVLELMCEREMKKGKETNEVIAFKLHYLGFTLREMSKEKVKAKSEEVSGNKWEDKMKFFIRRMLTGRTSDGMLEYQDRFFRESIREYAYTHSTILQQLVMHIKDIHLGDSAATFQVITSLINGQSGFKDGQPCATCGEGKAEKRCTVCKAVYYCDKECQKMCWFSHKKVCDKLKVIYEKRLAEIEKEKDKEPEPEKPKVIDEREVAEQVMQGLALNS